jgi:hypothetical protein
MCLLAVLRAQDGRANDALALAEEALLVSQEADDHHGIAAALLTRAEVAYALGQADRAVADLWAARTTLVVQEVSLTHAEEESFGRLLGQLLAAPERANDPLLTQLQPPG